MCMCICYTWIFKYITAKHISIYSLCACELLFLFKVQPVNIQAQKQSWCHLWHIRMSYLCCLIAKHLKKFNNEWKALLPHNRKVLGLNHALQLHTRARLSSSSGAFHSFLARSLYLTHFQTNVFCLFFLLSYLTLTYDSFRYQKAHNNQCCVYT